MGSTFQHIAVVNIKEADSLNRYGLDIPPPRGFSVLNRRAW
jgi:hypothetical protein